MSTATPPSSESTPASATPPKTPSKSRRLGHGWLVAAVVFHLLPFATRPALIGGDEPHYAVAAHSLALDGDLDLADDYASVVEGSSAAGRKRAGQELDPHVLPVGGREVFSHPVGLPLLATPVLALWHGVLGAPDPDIPLALMSLAITFAGLVAGWRLLRDLLDDEAGAAWVVFAVYFASPLAFYSRTFFTEPHTWAFAILAVRQLTQGRPLRGGLLLALALAMKETAVLLVGPILLGCWLGRGLGFALRATAGSFVFGLFFMAKNWLLVGEPLATFQPFQLGNPWEGLIGLLASPERGLLWFAPLLAVALLGFALPRRPEEPRFLGLLAALAVAGYLAVSASWIDWRGGTSYATRLLLPILPVLAIPLLRGCAWLGARRLHGLLVGLASLGFAVQLCAAVDPVPAFWGAEARTLVAEDPVTFVVGLLIAGVVQWRAAPSGFAPPKGPPQSPTVAA